MSTAKKSKLAAADAYQRGNITAARVILADPKKYGGALLVWAKRVIERVGGNERVA